MGDQKTTFLLRRDVPYKAGSQGATVDQEITPKRLEEGRRDVPFRSVAINQSPQKRMKRK